VCVKDGTARDANGNIIPSYIPQVVTDEVTISQALYDPSAGTLTVAASSSDVTAPPTLTLAYAGFRADLVNGQVVVPGVLAPPSEVQVLSSYLGVNRYQVSTGFSAGAPSPAGVPVAVNDTFTFLEDSGPQSLAILANDSNAAGGTVALVAAPRLGAASVNADGTVTYTPNLNASGTDSFTYSVTVGTQVSNTAAVTLNITPVNDPPVAVNDTAATSINVPIAISVLANDIDPDGAADMVAAVNVTQPAAGASITVAGGTVTFTATAAGTYTFTYQVQDSAGAISANAATVTVNVAGAEAISIAQAAFVTSKGRLRVSGTISPAAGQTLRIDVVNSAGSVLSTPATAVPSDAAGAWALDIRGVTLPAGASAVKVTSSNGTVSSLALTFQ
jgi:hypothetical protein